jgi:hypothetical protein
MLHLTALRVRVSSLVRAASTKSRMGYALPVVLLAMLGFSSPAFSQSCTGLCLQQVSCPGNATTSVTGRVFAPNGTDPLPNVLVYIPNAPVAAFTPGVACDQAGEPASGSPLVGTTTAVDGSFTLTNVPVGSGIPLVIQTGRWRRQIVISSVNQCANTALDASQTRLPRNKSEGDIPRIAVSTGSADAVECVLRKIGVDPSEFTSSLGDGRINLFGGANSPGGVSSTAPGTPNETTLVDSQAVLNQYDLVMFGCQGNDFEQTSIHQQHLINYANAGGRVFLTHDGYVWLYNDAPFSTTAHWNPEEHPSPPDQVGFIDTTFPRGLQLAEWLQVVSASTTFGEIPLQIIRKDQDGVVAPTQSWMTIKDTTFPGTVVQFTFNTPVGSPSQNQCGRVLYNQYHVENANVPPNTVFPAECAAGTLSSQEKLLEYDLFDLSTFISPDNPPTAAVTVTNAPTSFSRGDTNDTVTVNVTNTSQSAPTNPSLVLTVSRPVGLSVTSIAGANAGTGWICALNLLTCTRTTGLNANTSDPVILGVSVTAGPSSTPITLTVKATLSGGGIAASLIASDGITVRGAPTFIWPAPAAITYGTALDGTQLDATVSTAGTLVYTPPAGTVLNAGHRTLGVTLIPSDPANYVTDSSTVGLTVNQATPTITWANPAPITYPTPLSATQLNATASTTGTFQYTPASGAVLDAGPHTLSVTVTPDSANYTSASTTVQIGVQQATQAINFTGLPANATFGTVGPYTLNGAASSGLPVSYSVSGPATLSSTTLTITGPGTVAVTASQAGNTNFNAATPVTQTIVVSPTTGTVMLSATTVYSKVAAGYQAVITIVNNGTGTALNVQLTSATLGIATATTALPVPLGAIASGGGKQIVTVTYPGAAGAAGATVIQKLAATYTGGALTNSGRAVLP